MAKRTKQPTKKSKRARSKTAAPKTKAASEPRKRKTGKNPIASAAMEPEPMVRRKASPPRGAPLKRSRSQLPEGPGPMPPDYVPGQLVVRLKPDVVPWGVNAHMPFATFAAALPERLRDPFEALQQRGVIRSVIPVFGDGDYRGLQALAAVGDDPKRAGLSVLKLKSDADVGPVLRELEATGAFSYVERVPNRWIPEPQTTDLGAGTLAADWPLTAIRWPGNALPDASRLAVMVMDTGIDLTHPDLVVESADPANTTDENGHGTHVAGIGTARPSHAAGMQGVARCRLVVTKVFEADGFAFARYLRALEGAAANGISVINLSLGATRDNRDEREMIALAVARGVCVITAMGNFGHRGNPTMYPAAYVQEGAFAVGAVDSQARHAVFSNMGPHVALVAPGVDVRSTLPLAPYPPLRPQTRYGLMSGTSMAAPFVAGAALLLRARHPDWSPADIYRRLKETATREPWMGDPLRYGAGLLNLSEALR